MLQYFARKTSNRDWTCQPGGVGGAQARLVCSSSCSCWGVLDHASGCLSSPTVVVSTVPAVTGRPATVPAVTDESVAYNASHLATTGPGASNHRPLFSQLGSGHIAGIVMGVLGSLAVILTLVSAGQCALWHDSSGREPALLGCGAVQTKPETCVLTRPCVVARPSFCHLRRIALAVRDIRFEGVGLHGKTNVI